MSWRVVYRNNHHTRPYMVVSGYSTHGEMHFARTKSGRAIRRFATWEAADNLARKLNESEGQ